MNCPSCNKPGAYVGLSVIECSSIHCKYFKAYTVTVTNEWKTPIYLDDDKSPTSPTATHILNFVTGVDDAKLEEIKRKFAEAVRNAGKRFMIPIPDVVKTTGEDLDRLAGLFDLIR